MASQIELETHVTSIFTDFQPKKKQLDAMKSIINGKDTLCVLPTAFGKSLIYQALPKLTKLLKIHENPIVVILSPLVSLIDDQVQSANKMTSLDLKACAINRVNFNDVSSGKYNLLFGTPE